MRRRVVVTGLGLVTPLGTGVEKTWEGLVAGRSGIGPITRFDPAGFDTRIAGEVRDLVAEQWVDKKEARRLDPFQLYAVAAGTEALRDSGFQIEPANAERVGCLVGSGMGGMTAIEQGTRTLAEKGPGRVSPFLVPQTLLNLAAGQLSIRFGIKGPNWSPVSACATGAHSIGEAARLIERGDCELALAGGSEAAITPLVVAGFNALKAMCADCNDQPEKASRPFDRDRSGFVPAEGAAILVLEEREHALRRGARIHAELAGYGANSDAHHITAPSVGGEGAARCMRLALADAGIPPQAVGYVNAHGTSTPFNDASETQALKAVYGEHARKLAVSSTKSMLGHLLGAAGAVEAAITALAVARGILPPTINYRTRDPECDLDYVPNEARRAQVEYAMSNSFGFGGTNAVLVFKRHTA